jgi:hypothetical protein
LTESQLAFYNRLPGSWQANLFCHQHQKLKLVHFFTTARRQQSCAPHSMRWDISSQQPPYKQTTPQHVGLQTKVSNSNVLAQSICSTTGYTIGNNRGMSTFFGHLTQTILLTSLPNIFQLDSIRTCAPHMSIPCNTLLPNKPSLTLCLSCKGVLNLHQGRHTMKSNDKQIVKMATRLAIG